VAVAKSRPDHSLYPVTTLFGLENDTAEVVLDVISVVNPNAFGFPPPGKIWKDA
jgi:hypothetical protein